MGHMAEIINSLASMVVSILYLKRIEVPRDVGTMEKAI